MPPHAQHVPIAVTDFLFLQRLGADGVEPMPYQAVVRELDECGVKRAGEGGLEIATEDDELADLVLVVGDSDSGVQCIAFVHPAYDEALRKIVLRCLDNLGCAAFDDALTRAYVSARHAHRPLPPELARETAAVLRRVTHPVQLWPDWTESALPGADRYAVFARSAAEGETLVQYFDAKDPHQDIFEISVAARPAAWNAGTVAAFRMLQARVDRLRDAHPRIGVAYRYDDPETPLREAEFARETPPLRHAITTISPWPGEARRPRFTADREIFASFSSQAALAARSAQEEFRIALDHSPASVGALAALLDRLHEDFAQRGFQREHMTWTVRAGSYLSLVAARAIGGQLGFTNTARARVPCVRMHTGRLQFPVLRVLDHIVNGSTDSVRTWFADAAQADASRTLRDADWVCNIPGYCQILLGRADLKHGALPLAGKIPRERLDFGVESLHALDAYLAQVRADPTVEDAALGALIVVAGAYLGEVVRSQQHDTWLWVTYDDFAAANPDFAQRRPREPGLMAFLDSPSQSCYPLAHVASVLAGQDASCHAFAVEVLRRDEPPPVPAAVPALAAAAEKPTPTPTNAPARTQSNAPGKLTRWVLRAGHVCLLAPILHFVFVATNGTAPIPGITRLWTFAVIFYAVGAALSWRDRRR